MIFGSFTFFNFALLLMCAFGITVGVLLMRYARQFEDAAEKIQRSMGPIGDRVADRRSRANTLLVAWGFVALGIVAFVFALIGHE